MEEYKEKLPVLIWMVYI